MTAATSDPPDPNELARQFLDLWQRQMSLLASEGGLADAFALMTELMAGRLDGTQFAQSGENRRPGGAAAAAGASRDRGDDRDELARRLAACEARLDRLEQALARRGAKPRAAARRKRS